VKRIIQTLSVLAALASTGAFAARPTPRRQVFTCSLGKKEVHVTAVGRTLLYQFGTHRRPEVSIVGDPKRGNVHYKADLLAHSGINDLRFSQGPYSYVLYNYWSTPDYRGEGEADRSGLLVFRDFRNISKLPCKSGPAFSESYDLEWLPEDNLDDFRLPPL